MASIKKYFNDKGLLIRNWCADNKSFLLVLICLFVSLFISIYTVYALILVVLVLVAGAILFDFEKCLSFFMFCYSFEAVFYITKNSKNTFVFPIVYSILFSIAFIKYIILLFKKKKKLNIKRLVPLALFIIYILIPINPIKISDVIKYVIAFGVLYLLLEYKDEINFNNVLIVASIGLVLSIIISPLLTFSNRMEYIQFAFYNQGIEKLKAVFVNPNWLAVYSIVMLSICCYKFVFNDLMWGFPILVVLPYTYRTISRDYILCLIIVISFLLVVSIVKRKKTCFLKYIGVIVFIAVVALIQLDVTNLYIIRVKNTYNEIVTLVGITSENGGTEEELKDETDDKSYNKDDNASKWIDGTPIDPGRAGLWKRYIRDYKSSPKKIIFGAGVSADVLGIAPHNTYINILWQFGVVGSVALIGVFYLILRDLLKSKNVLSFLLLFILSFICMFESNLFNYVAVMMIILLFCSTHTGKKIGEIGEQAIE